MNNMTKSQYRVTKMVIPTYPEPDKERLPMYCENRSHQRTSGRVYPNVIINNVVRDRKEDKEYTAIILENDFIELIILPEIGGRIFGARDKTNSYDFFYRQHVIKPALIGTLGSWISGGAEFNWPMHHRPSTFMPVDYDIEESQDGSVTVWLSEHESLDRMKSMVGICIYPNKAMFETRVRLFNRTAMPHSFLWWENIGVPVNKDYQVFFPQDVNHVYYHYKKSVTEYPIANSMYNGIDYRQKKPDIRWHKNTVWPTSYFSARSNYDFFGGFDHGRKAGVVHIANHHISPGKKLFTWAYNQLSKSWENALTDTDGPYAELMAGVYSDNQPDFSWLEPYETKEFSQYWYPIKEIGEPKNANTRVALNYQIKSSGIKVLVYAVEKLDNAAIEVFYNGAKFHSVTRDFPVSQTSSLEFDLPEGFDESKLSILVLDKDNKEIISFQKPGPIEEMVPEPTKVVPSPCERDNKKKIHREGFYSVAPSPYELDNPEELFLTGLHLKQYRDPLVKPDAYWQKAVEKDPAHYKSNNALGFSALKEGRFTDAENYFQKAIVALTIFNPNPRDGEAFYGLGLALKGQGKNTAAYDAFYKSIWNYQWRSAGYYSLAQLDCINKDFATARTHLKGSLITNTDNLKAQNLLAAVERLLGNNVYACDIAGNTLKKDPLDYWAMNELSLVEDSSSFPEDHFISLMNSNPSQTLLDVVFDYFQAGLFSDAINLITRFIRYMKDEDMSPMIYYVYGYLLEKVGQDSESEKAYRTAKEKNPDYCFPSRPEEMIILQEIALKRKDGRAAYYLGNLLYDKEQYEEAILQWEKALQSDEDYYVLYRNLGMAYYNNRGDNQKSIEFVQKALKLEPQDPQLIFELNHLMQLVNRPLDERFKFLEDNISIVQNRDDLYLEWIKVHNQAGECGKAIKLLKEHSFTPCEGGEHTIVEQFIFAHFKLGRLAYINGDFQSALTYFQQGQVFPDNLGAGIWDTGMNIPCIYYEALCLDHLGEDKRAREIYEYISNMGIDFFTKMYQPAIYYYQAMVFKKLGETKKAESQLSDCIKTWESEKVKKDHGYFKATPFFISYLEKSECVRSQHFSYLLGLANAGLGNNQGASACFSKALEFNSGHLWAALELEVMNKNPKKNLNKMKG